MCVCMFSHSVVSNSSTTSWTLAHQALLGIGFPRQEYWSGFPFPLPRDLSDPGIETSSPALQADSLPLSHLGSPRPNYRPQLFLLSKTTYPSIRKLKKKFCKEKVIRNIKKPKNKQKSPPHFENTEKASELDMARMLGLSD